MTPEQRERTRRYIDRIERRFVSLRDEVEEDVARVRHLSPEQIDQRLGSLIRAAWRVLESLPPDERERLLRRDPPAPDFQATWQRLVDRRRAGR